MTLSETVRASGFDRGLPTEALVRLRDLLLDDFIVQMDTAGRVRSRTADDRDDAGGGLGQFEVDWQVGGENGGPLTEIEAALVRIAVGRYGFCEDCARSIPSARLEAIPHTRYCAPCQRYREAAR